MSAEDHTETRLDMVILNIIMYIYMCRQSRKPHIIENGRKLHRTKTGQELMNALLVLIEILLRILMCHNLSFMKVLITFASV